MKIYDLKQYPPQLFLRSPNTENAAHVSAEKYTYFWTIFFVTGVFANW